MKRVKRKSKMKPLKIILKDLTKIIVPRQSQFRNSWLRQHGCPFVSAYEVLQFCGVKKVGKKKTSVTSIYKYCRKHFPKKFRPGGTITIRALTLALKSLLKGKAYVKFFPPERVNGTNVNKYLNAGSIIIMTRRIPVIHFYVILRELGKTYILNAGKCKRISVKRIVKVKCNHKYYGGMIVITRKKKK